MRKKCFITGIAAIVCASILLLGCGKESEQTVQTENCFAKVSDIRIPEEVKIAGLGEATHGNAELQSLKKEVFQTLVENKQCRIFALEGDFGGCVKVNDYIHGGEGTAKEAVKEIGFWLYTTAEMEEFVEWLRTYNETVSSEEQVSFYGFDMQRYDNNKEILLDYLEKVDAERGTELEEKLRDFTDATAYDLTEEVNISGTEVMTSFLKTMEENKESYISKSDEKSYKIAYACGECILQNATIQSGTVNYNMERDRYMAEKVETILDIEKGERILISGHNGHIQKKSSNASYTCMGEILESQYGDAYFTIGTDFIEGEVNVVNSEGNAVNVSISQENALKDRIKNLEGNSFYLEVEKAMENEEMVDILNNPLKMISIGETFDEWQTKVAATYSVKMVPAENYDGMILLKTVTPIERSPK